MIARGRRSGRRMARVTDDSLYSVDNEPEQLDEEDDDEGTLPFYRNNGAPRIPLPLFDWPNGN